MNNEQLPTQQTSSTEITTAENTSSNGWRTFGIVVITIAITVSLGYWVVNSYLFPSSFTPVELNNKEQLRLDNKLKRLAGASAVANGEKLEPEAYSEIGADREINISEKEFNALLANNTNLASKLAIDFSDNLASARLLIDLDPELPVFGGKTLKVTAGVEIKLIDGKPGVVLRGVSVWGVPLPNAWLGNMKNADLSKEFAQQGGFWQTLNDGIEDIEVKEGQLHIKLKE